MCNAGFESKGKKILQLAKSKTSHIVATNVVTDSNGYSYEWLQLLVRKKN